MSNITWSDAFVMIYPLDLSHYQRTDDAEGQSDGWLSTRRSPSQFFPFNHILGSRHWAGCWLYARWNSPIGWWFVKDMLYIFMEIYILMRIYMRWYVWGQMKTIKTKKYHYISNISYNYGTSRNFETNLLMYIHIFRRQKIIHTQIVIVIGVFSIFFLI